jgi:hypothetical protein
MLRDLVANPEPGGEDANNWLGMAAQSHQQLALDCLIEAWNWLYSNGLVATDLEKQHRPGPVRSIPGSQELLQPLRIRRIPLRSAGWS